VSRRKNKSSKISGSKREGEENAHLVHLHEPAGAELNKETQKVLGGTCGPFEGWRGGKKKKKKIGHLKEGKLRVGNSTF